MAETKKDTEEVKTEQIKEEKRMCMECGQNFNPSEMIPVGRKMYCKECASDLLKEGKDAKVNIVNTNTQTQAAATSGGHVIKRNYMVALLLSIFVGWLGIDRFYLGQGFLGFLKLITLGFYGIWWFIDILLIGTKSIRGVEWE